MIITATGKDIGKIHTRYSRNLAQLKPIDKDEHILLTPGAPVIFLMKTEVTNPRNKAKVVIRTGVTGKVAGWRGKNQISAVYIKVGGYSEPFPVTMCQIEEKGKTHWGFPFITSHATSYYKTQGETVDKIILDTAFQLTPAMFYTGASRVRKSTDLFLSYNGARKDDELKTHIYVNPEINVVIVEKMKKPYQ